MLDIGLPVRPPSDSPKKARNRSLLHFVFFLELVYAASRIDQLCFARKEGMAIRTNLNEDLFFRGTRLVLGTARAANHRVFINGMYTCFHQADPLMETGRQAIRDLNHGPGDSA